MTIYRLASGLRDGQSGDGEFRLAQSIRPGADPGARWYRTRARAFNVPGQRLPMLAWQLADISQERAEQEDETPFDETRLQYSGVEEGDGDVDVAEYEEAGALFDDPEQTVLLEGGMDDPAGSDGWR